MKIPFLVLLLAFFLFWSGSVSAQNLTDMNALDLSYKNCLDSGNNMSGCSQKYYFQVDSLLNVVYKSYRDDLNEHAKAALKKDQLKWLKIRDNYFENISADGLEGNDARMLVIDE